MTAGAGGYPPAERRVLITLRVTRRTNSMPQVVRRATAQDPGLHPRGEQKRGRPRSRDPFFADPARNDAGECPSVDCRSDTARLTSHRHRGRPRRRPRWLQSRRLSRPLHSLDRPRHQAHGRSVRGGLGPGRKRLPTGMGQAIPRRTGKIAARGFGMATRGRMVRCRARYGRHGQFGTSRPMANQHPDERPLLGSHEIGAYWPQNLFSRG